MPFSAEKQETGQINSATANINMSLCSSLRNSLCSVCLRAARSGALSLPAMWRMFIRCARKAKKNYENLHNSFRRQKLGLDTAGTRWFERPHVASSGAPSPRPRHAPPPASSPANPRIVLGSAGANKPFRPVTSSDFCSHLQSIKSI